MSNIYRVTYINLSTGIEDTELVQTNDIRKIEDNYADVVKIEPLSEVVEL